MAFAVACLNITRKFNIDGGLQNMFTIIGIILVVGLCMWIGIVAVEFAFFFSIGLAVCFFFARSKAAKDKPTERVCPMCGNSNIKFKYVTQGSSSDRHTTGFSNTNFGARNARRTSISSSSVEKKIHHKNVAYCDDCGFSFDFTTQKDIDDKCKTLLNGEIGSIVVAIILGIALFVINGYLH